LVPNKDPSFGSDMQETFQTVGITSQMQARSSDWPRENYEIVARLTKFTVY